MAYRFIQKYSYLFGVRWLLRRLNIYPNAYYNHLKNRKKESIQEKENIKNKIKEIFYFFSLLLNCNSKYHTNKFFSKFFIRTNFYYLNLYLPIE